MKTEHPPNALDVNEMKPPYGYLIENIGRFMKEIPGISHNLQTCYQCGGSGYDSAEKTASCCSCYGMGKLFTKDDQLVDYRTQRELVQKLRDKTIEESKKD